MEHLSLPLPPPPPWRLTGDLVACLWGVVPLAANQNLLLDAAIILPAVSVDRSADGPSSSAPGRLQTGAWAMCGKGQRAGDEAHREVALDTHNVTEEFPLVVRAPPRHGKLLCDVYAVVRSVGSGAVI